MNPIEAMKMFHPRPVLGAFGRLAFRLQALAGAYVLCTRLAVAPLLGQSAAPADLMTYQGYLVDANGAALANANPVNYTVVFRIYGVSSGGSSLWSESQTVTVDKGNFSVVLGEGVQEGSEPKGPLSALFASPNASDRFIGITVKGLSGGDPEIMPRLRLLPSPYAFLARSANGLVAADGTSLLVPDSGRLRLSQAIQSTGGNPRGVGAVDLQVLRQPSQLAQVASGRASTLSGGENNTASGELSVVSGGSGNTASGLHAAALGGSGNTASGQYSATSGGRQNTASGDYSFAAGRRAGALHAGSFVWSDGQDADFASTGVNQFMVRASGGAAINTSPEAGVALKVAGKFKSDSAEVGSFTVNTLQATTVSGFGTVPTGGIIMWSGSESAVPAGWALCNGLTVNGRVTPDLRGKFVIGSSGTYAVNAQGGSTVAALTQNHLPSHAHSASGSVDSGGAHTHPFRTFHANFSHAGGASEGSTKWDGDGEFIDYDAVRSGGSHGHSFSVTTSSVGLGQAFSIMPPYYALAFIMRVQ